MRRAGSRARSVAFAAAISSRSPRSRRWLSSTRWLRSGCEHDLARRITGHADTVGEALGRERPLLRALPGEPLQTAEQVTRASTPRRWSRSAEPLLGPRRSRRVAVTATIGARKITIAHGGRQVARHDRLVGRFGTSARLDHYLELLARKPAALIGSVALAQERDRGAWPDCLDELWARIAERYGPSEAARQMVDVLMLAREHGPARTELAVRGALAAGAHDGRAVAVLARRTGAARRPHH